MNPYIFIFFSCVFISLVIINVTALEWDNSQKDKLRKGRRKNTIFERKNESYGLSNFEILKNINEVSSIEIASNNFFDIISNTRLVQRPGAPGSPPPIYRYVPNIHDKNENIGARLVFLGFALLVIFIVFFIFYFIFKSYVKHIKYINS